MLSDTISIYIDILCVMNKKIDIKKYLNSLAEPNRLAILSFLKDGERCACEIHPKLKLPQNLSSHHLKVLKHLDLLKSRRDGTKVLYSRNEKVIKNYQSLLTKIII
jgi:ArsR family transcriptional regulator